MPDPASQAQHITPTARDTAPRKHPTTTRDEAPGGRGIVLNPTFTWGTTCYVNKKRLGEPVLLLRDALNSKPYSLNVTRRL